MRSWFLVRGYPKDLIEAEMKKFKCSPKNRNTKRGKSLKTVTFVITYHTTLKSMNKVILKYLNLYMEKEVKMVFTHKRVISFWLSRKLSSYLVRAKLYPTKRKVRSCKCGEKYCEVCINVIETSTFTSTVTGETYTINHRFDCHERCLIYLWPVIRVKGSMLGRLLTNSNQNGTTTNVTLESTVRELNVCNNICLTIFAPLTIAAS